MDTTGANATKHVWDPYSVGDDCYFEREKISEVTIIDLIRDVKKRLEELDHYVLKNDREDYYLLRALTAMDQLEDSVKNR